MDELRELEARLGVDVTDYSLLQRALTRLVEQLPRTAPPALITSPGLLERYGQLPWLSELAQTTGRAGGLHGAWLLVPWEDSSTPPASSP